MNTLLNLCLWHSLYISGLVTTFVFFALLILPVTVLVNNVRQRHNGRSGFKVVWLPPWWWMECFYVVDYITDTVYEKIKSYERIEKHPALTYQEHKNMNSKRTRNTIERIIEEDGIVAGLLLIFLACLTITTIYGVVVWVILGIASLLLFLWWLILPLIVAYLVFSFLHRKYHEYQSTLEKRRNDNEELRAIIEEWKKTIASLQSELDGLKSNPSPCQEPDERVSAVDKEDKKE